MDETNNLTLVDQSRKNFETILQIQPTWLQMHTSRFLPSNIMFDSFLGCLTQFHDKQSLYIQHTHTRVKRATSPRTPSNNLSLLSLLIMRILFDEAKRFCCVMGFFFQISG